MDSKKCGLIISLMKYAFSVQTGNIEGKNVLGYFDALKLDTVNNWLGFMPGNVSTDEELTVVSRYQLKLLFPQGQTREILKENGCYCDIWEKPREESDTLFNTYPCISVILVNLTDRFKNYASNQTEQNAGHWNAYKTVLEWFGELIGRFEMKEKLKQSHTCILPSIGYSDYCILMAEESWDIAMELVRKLHEARWEPRVESGRLHMHLSTDVKCFPVLSTDYMMPVFHSGNTEGLSDFSCDLTAHVNLAPGVSIEMLAKQLGEGIQIEQVSGTSDCMLTAKNGNQQKLLNYLISIKTSNQDKSLFLSTRATLQKELTYKTLNPKEFEPLSQESMGCIQGIWDALEQYAEVAMENRCHMRLVHACKKTITTIENISREKHNVSFRGAINDFIEDFTENLEVLVAAVKDASDSLEVVIKEKNKAPRKKVEELQKKIKELQEEKQDYLRQASYALEIFRNRFGSFVADITRSDCFFMETEQYNHESISSATSLILGYNRLANGFAKTVCMLMDPSTDPEKSPLRYSFVVTSGGCDRTECTNLFPYAEPDENEKGQIVQEHLPFLVQMSELGLFDCSGTVLRLFHECSHYCGNRERKQRLLYLIEFTAGIYGRLLSQALLDKGGTVELLKNELEKFLTETAKKEMLFNAVDTVYETCRIELSEKLTELLKQALIAGLKEEIPPESLPANYESLPAEEQIAAIADFLGEANCIADNLRKRMRRILIENFYAYEINEDLAYSTNQFAKDVYLATLYAERDFYKGCDDRFKEVSPTMIACGYERRYRDAQLNQEKKTG